MTHNKSNILNRRTKYSAQFKEQAVERAKKEGIPKIAKDLGIHQAMLYTWRRQLEKTGVPFEDQKIQDAELARLKREVSRLSEENAFLKKATACVP